MSEPVALFDLKYMARITSPYLCIYGQPITMLSSFTRTKTIKNIPKIFETVFIQKYFVNNASVFNRNFVNWYNVVVEQIGIM